MSSLSGALDESALRLPKSEPHALDDVEMASSSPAKHAPLHSEIGTHGHDEQDHEMEDLFGNDNDIDEAGQGRDRSEAESPTASGQEHDDDRIPSPERERRHALEYEEDENPPDTVDIVQEADVSFPNLPVPKSSDGNNWVVRMPNFVKMDTKPFHPDTYLGPEEEEAMQGESLREKSMTIKLKVENTVRWRWIKDQHDQDKRQSNSRIIRWSDGTLSLLLGKELFDITQTVDNSASIPRQSVHPSSSSSQSLSQQTPTKPIPTASSSSSLLGSHGHGLTYLVAQHKRSQVLQSEAVVTGYMSLRPTGMQSETHRMLVRAVGQKHNKVARLRMAPNPTSDPERNLRELAKLSAKKGRRKSDYMTMDELGARKRRHGLSRRATGSGVMFSSDEEGGAEYDGYDEEDDETGSARKAKRKPKAEKKSGAEDYQEDDFVVADSDEDEEGIPSRKRARDVEEVEEDALEKLDAKIEALDAKKKKRSGSGAAKTGDASDETEENDDMDVESEEEEDDIKVRRAGGGRKRAHITMEEEEE